MEKKVLVLLLTILFLIATYINTSAEDIITIRIAWWGSQLRHQKTLEAIELFKKRFPEVDIQPIFTGWREYWDTMATYAAGGNLPDIMQHDYKYFNLYNSNNILIDMNQYVGNIIQLGDVDDSLLALGRNNGQLYGIPAGLNTYTILYDPVKFKEAGIKEPSYNWNWDEYKEICRELHNKLGIYAATSLPMATRNITGLEHYIRQYGQSLFADTSKGLGFTEDLFVEFYNMDFELTRDGVFAPGELRLENYTIENDLIVYGQTAMAAYWTNQIIAISEASGKSLKMLPFPRAVGQVQSGYYLKPSMYWAITKDSKYPEHAARFINFLVNDVEANHILNGDRGMPISARVRTSMESSLDDTEKRMFDFIRYISQEASIIEPPQPAQYDRVIEILEELHFRILDETLTPQKAYQELKRRTESVLNNN